MQGSFCAAGLCFGSLANPYVQSGFQKGCVGNGRFRVGEAIGDFKCMVADKNARDGVEILAHYVWFFLGLIVSPNLVQALVKQVTSREFQTEFGAVYKQCPFIWAVLWKTHF